MTKTTEPAREQIEKRIAQLEWLLRGPEPAVGWETDLAVYRMALRTLDAEAQIAAMTERAEKAERERDDVSDECSTLRTEHVRMRSALVSAEARAEKAERERDETVSVMREIRVAWDAAIDQRDAMRARLADAERRIAELSPPTVPTTDARLDCEASSLLLLSTWARRVMMREKNRAKGVPSESVGDLLFMAREEISEALDAFHENAPTDDILAELGDAAAIISFAMREVESRRNR